jgi:hypothetical protein
LELPSIKQTAWFGLDSINWRRGSFSSLTIATAARARNWQQTIRPNGEALEGNPRENYLHYRDELVARAMQHVRCSNDDSA